MNKDIFEPSPFVDEDDENSFNLKEIIFIHISYWKWFVLSVIISLGFAFVYIKIQTPIYAIHSSILLKDPQKGVGNQDDLMKQLDIFSSDKVVDNEIEVLQSYTLMRKVVDSLKLDISYFRPGFFRKIEMYKNSPIQMEMIKPTSLSYKPLEFVTIDRNTVSVNDVKIPVNKVVNTLYGTMRVVFTGKSDTVKKVIVTLQSKEGVVEALTNGLKIDPSSKMSTVLIMGINNAVPEKGKDILNKLIEAYNQAGLSDKNLSTSNTLRFIEDRLRLLSKELGDAEKGVETYKAKEGITDISAASQLFLQNVQANDSQLNQIKIQIAVLDNIERYLRSPRVDRGPVPSTLLGVEDPTLLSLIDALSKLELQRQNTAKLVKPGHPMMQATDEQINSLKLNINDNIRSLRESLNSTKRHLDQQSDSMKTIIRSIPQKERILVDITRQEAIKNDLYTYLLKQREATALSYASTVSDTRIVDSAISTGAPIKPKASMIYLLFASLGTIAPIGIIYLLHIWNDKIRTRKDIEKGTKIPIIAEISQTDNAEPIVIGENGRTAIAEQIRALRTNISFLSPDVRIQTIMFTSSISGEGKSFISLNLSASLSLVGKKVVLLELDLRKPKLQHALKTNFKSGLSNYLIGEIALDKIIYPIAGYTNFDIITSGTIPPNPVELLLSGKMDELFAELRVRYDYIVIDAPPIGLVTDAQVISKYVDSTFYLIRHDYTPKEQLKSINRLYQEGRLRPLNLIFNGVKIGGKYGYQSGYGYGYGYYE